MTNPNLIKLAQRLGNEELPRESPRSKPSPIVRTSELQGYVFVPSINLYVAKEKILHNKTWEQTQQELSNQNQKMLTIPQFVSFINYLRNGYQNRKEAESILDEILTVRSPWRSEWLDAYFEKRKDGFYVLTENKTKP